MRLVDAVHGRTQALAVAEHTNRHPTFGSLLGQAMDHVRRILKPRGRFVLHVHNYWFNLYDPGGPWWLLKNLAQSLFRRDVQRGDKHFPYRGLASMYLHVFTQRELRRLVRASGFKLLRLIPLDPRRHQQLRNPRLLPQLRANGWIAVCE